VFFQTGLITKFIQPVGCPPPVVTFQPGRRNFTNSGDVYRYAFNFQQSNVNYSSHLQYLVSYLRRVLMIPLIINPLKCSGIRRLHL